MTDPLLEKQWETFQQENPTPYEHIDTEELRTKLIEELGYVSGMTVEEYTLYQKWCEVKNKYPAQVVNTLFGEESQLVNLEKDKLLPLCNKFKAEAFILDNEEFKKLTYMNLIYFLNATRGRHIKKSLYITI